ncbi:MAG: hypothetical protein K9L62_15935 [Vallitaleaceae bacterium]|nr:hypothetical protein [Vallitaleaceae bacterium]
MKMLFSGVIAKYEREYTIERQVDGQLVDGRWETGTPEQFLSRLILLPANSEEIEDYEGGGYTTQWKKILQRENVANQLKKNDIIIDSEGERYEVRDRTSWLGYSDFTSWLSKKVVVGND